MKSEGFQPEAQASAHIPAPAMASVHLHLQDSTQETPEVHGHW